MVEIYDFSSDSTTLVTSEIDTSREWEPTNIEQINHYGVLSISENSLFQDVPPNIAVDFITFLVGALGDALEHFGKLGKAFGRLWEGSGEASGGLGEVLGRLREAIYI